MENRLLFSVDATRHRVLSQNKVHPTTKVHRYSRKDSLS